MIRRRYLLGAALGTALLILGVVLLGQRGTEARAASETRSNTGPVAFHLTPQGMQAGQFAVEVRVDTHSGDLAQLDLQAATALRVGDTEYRPAAPVRLGGHHAGGMLLFDVPQPPQAFEIVIRGLHGMDDLTFRWP